MSVDRFSYYFIWPEDVSCFRFFFFFFTVASFVQGVAEGKGGMLEGGVPSLCAKHRCVRSVTVPWSVRRQASLCANSFVENAWRNVFCTLQGVGEPLSVLVFPQGMCVESTVVLSTIV